MRIRLEKQLEFDFMKDVGVKDSIKDKRVKWFTYWLGGMMVLPPLAAYYGNNMHGQGQQIFEPIKTIIEYIF